jgi:hypothetical protein
MSQENLEVVRAAADAWAAGDLDEVERLYTSDAGITAGHEDRGGRFLWKWEEARPQPLPAALSAATGAGSRRGAAGGSHTGYWAGDVPRERGAGVTNL